MPAKKKKAYESKARITTIAATSRASVKIKDNFFTVEYHEERVIPEVDGVDINVERELLWNTVNAECDNQVEEISRTFKKQFLTFKRWQVILFIDKQVK